MKTQSLGFVCAASAAALLACTEENTPADPAAASAQVDAILPGLLDAALGSTSVLENGQSFAPLLDVVSTITSLGGGGEDPPPAVIAAAVAAEGDEALDGAQVAEFLTTKIFTDEN